VFDELLKKISDYKIPQVMLISAILLGVGLLVENSFITRHLEEQRKIVTSDLYEVSSQIDSTISQTLNLVEGLTAFISSNPDLDQQDFARFAREILRKNPTLRNIAAAPDLVIKLIYPLEGNEAAIGLDYKTHPTQRKAAMLAVEKHKTVIAGPITLVQGGVAFVSRTPVYFQHESPTQKQLWGLISSVIDADKFFFMTGIESYRQLKLAMRGNNATGAEGEVFYGDASLFNNQPVVSTINLPYGSWQIAAIPAKGWNTGYDWQLEIRSLYILIIVLLSTLYVSNKINKSRRIDAEIQSQLANVQKEMALQTNRMQASFLAMVSHELRTPMHAILNFSALGLKNADNDKSRHYFSNINISSRRLSALLNDLLDISKLESDFPDITFTAGDLHSLVKQHRAELDSLITDKSINIKLVHKGDTHGVFDSKLIGQVITNLLSNAIKFSPEKSEIIIETGRKTIHLNDKEQICLLLRIHDSGPGIPESELDSIFDKFVQSSKTIIKGQGTGLGLAISRRIIELHNGKIVARSPSTHHDRPGSPENPGATFEFFIPVENAPVRRAV
jgi:signal transduction histidine kinase